MNETQNKPTEIIDVPCTITIHYKENECALFKEPVSVSAVMNPETGVITGTLYAPKGSATRWFHHLSGLQNGLDERLTMWAEFKRGIRRTLDHQLALRFWIFSKKKD